MYIYETAARIQEAELRRAARERGQAARARRGDETPAAQENDGTVARTTTPVRPAQRLAC